MLKESEKRGGLQLGSWCTRPDSYHTKGNFGLAVGTDDTLERIQPPLKLCFLATIFLSFASSQGNDGSMVSFG